jgi:hypothetical protein
LKAPRPSKAAPKLLIYMRPLGLAGLAVRRQAGRPNHGHGACRLGRDPGGNAAQQRAQHRMLPRADDDMVDMIDLGEFQDGGGRVDGLDDVDGQPVVIEFQRRSITT